MRIVKSTLVATGLQLESEFFLKETSGNFSLQAVTAVTSWGQSGGNNIEYDFHFHFLARASYPSCCLPGTPWPGQRPARSRRRRTQAIAGVALVMLLSCVMATAGDAGRITGTVTDPSGAVVPGSRIQLRNPDTGAHYETLANAEGWYVFLAVPVGRYLVTASAVGFKPFLENRLQMRAGTTLQVDAHLAVTADNQSVVVEASAAVLDASNTQLGEAISEKQMTATPLNGRSYHGPAGHASRRRPHQLPAAQRSGHVGLHQHAAFRRPECRQPVHQRPAGNRQRLRRQRQQRGRRIQHGHGRSCPIWTPSRNSAS